MDAPVILELITAYGRLTAALNETYYLQDSDEIHRLEELVEELEKKAGVTWQPGGKGAAWTAQST